MKTDQRKKLKKVELLEILVAQSKKIEQLQEELDQTKRKLSDRRIKINRAGTLAEAAIHLNKVFEDADEAARQYLENVRMQSERKQAMQETKDLSVRKKRKRIEKSDASDDLGKSKKPVRRKKPESGNRHHEE